MSELPAILRGLPLDHVAIAVADLEAASTPYLLLGLESGVDELLPEQGVRVRMLQAAGSRIELIEPTGPQTPVARFLERRGPGLHHVALRVRSLDSEVERLIEEGARFTQPAPTAGHAGSRVIFLHPSWTGGVLLELVEHKLVEHKLVEHGLAAQRASSAPEGSETRDDA
ncbi:MAG: methylmalonyl-CoA epimerase [Trueperaceae bacterium]